MNMSAMKLLSCPAQRSRMFAVLVLPLMVMLLVSGCGEVDGGRVENQIELPVDSTLNLHCEDQGINENQCVLDDPLNPYADVNVNDDTKFALNDGAPSAKARFYLWATAQARNPTGENQYYTALSLHEVYSESASPIIQEQAKKAYRSVLDNFYLSATFFVVTVTQGDVAFAVAIKDIVGENLYNPTSAGLVSLYSDPIFALRDMSEWGYIYDTTNNILSAYQ